MRQTRISHIISVRGRLTISRTDERPHCLPSYTFYIHDTTLSLTCDVITIRYVQLVSQSHIVRHFTQVGGRQGEPFTTLTHERPKVVRSTTGTMWYKGSFTSSRPFSWCVLEGWWIYLLDKHTPGERINCDYTVIITHSNIQGAGTLVNYPTILADVFDW